MKIALFPRLSAPSALLLFLVGVSPLACPARTYQIDSLADLEARLQEAIAGDTLVVMNGTYPTTGQITVACRGTAEQPITIVAENLGRVDLTGVGGFNVVEPAAHVVISGFLFTHAAGKATIGAGTTHVRFSRNTFICLGEGANLSIFGDDAQIDYNEFKTKRSAGNMIAVSGTGGQIARRLWIHHNYFHDFGDAASNGSEMIRYGLLSAHGQSTGNGLIEHNLFSECHGISEFVSNRASANIYRYNVFIDSPNAHFELRQGDDCLLYGNVFRNTEGLRFYGDRQQIFSNYFESNYAAVSVGNGDGEIADGAPASTTHDRPDNCLVAFNTFINNKTHFRMSRRASGALGATHTTFVNNIIQGGEVGAKIDGPNIEPIWKDNLLWKTTKPRDFPATAYTAVDPRLAPGADGLWRPQDDSPALGSVTEPFPSVVVDLDGQPRPETRSKGADEPGIGPVHLRILTPAEVGPNAAVFSSAPSSPPPPAAESVQPAVPQTTPDPTSTPNAS